MFITGLTSFKHFISLLCYKNASKHEKLVIAVKIGDYL